MQKGMLGEKYARADLFQRSERLSVVVLDTWVTDISQKTYAPIDTGAAHEYDEIFAAELSNPILIAIASSPRAITRAPVSFLISAWPSTWSQCA